MIKRIYYMINLNNYFNISLGIGDWGLGIGDWGLGPIPNPQSPIPHPQSPIPNPHIKYILLLYEKNKIINFNIYILLIYLLIQNKYCFKIKYLKK